MYFPLLKKQTNRRNEKKNQTNKQTNQIKKKKTKANRSKTETISNKTNFVLLQWELLFYMIILKLTIDR